MKFKHVLGFSQGKTQNMLGFPIPYLVGEADPAYL
jgi:hypothetical protein